MVRRFMIALFVFAMPSLSSALQQVEFRQEFGHRGSGPGEIVNPAHIAMDGDGKIYVADKGNRRIHVMTKDGRTLVTWSGQRGDPWYLEEPAGIDVYGEKVFVTDALLNRVLIFSKDGKFIDQFGSNGDEPKQFDHPGGIRVHQGIIYVADTGNHRIQSFSLEGVYLGSMGKKGEDTGELRAPSAVAVDPQGIVYVADEGNNRVQAFTPTGKHHRSYYEMEEPSAIVTDSSGFYVADAGNYRVKKYGFNGNILASFGMKGDERARFRSISGISLDRNGAIYVADTEKNTIQVFAPEKAPERSVELAPPIHSVKWLHAIPASAGDVAWEGDTLYAPSAEENAILVIEQGAVRRIIRGQGKDGFREPKGIAIDPDGFLLVVDSGNNRIVKLKKDGSIVSMFGGSGGKDGLLSSPQGIAVSPQGIVYVADTGNERVQLFNTNGIYMGKIEEFGTMDQYSFDKPVDVALDPSGDIYVADEGKNVVLKFNSQKRFIAPIGREGEGVGEFSQPKGIIVTREEIFVLDAGNRRIQVFGHNGQFLRLFGAPGNGKGDFIEPTGFCLKEGITLFVSDRGNKKIQAFSLLYTPQTPLQLKAEGERGAISLSWSKNFESYFGSYRVYRSDAPGTYALVASPQTPEYRDRDVQSNTTYYYRVSTVAREGNESAKSQAAGGRSLKPVTPPPADLKASPSETEIALSWKPAEGPLSPSHYIVYREIEGAMKEIGRVKTPSFKDRGLKPKTEYRYAVTAASPDSEESASVSLKVATVLNRPVLEVTAVKIHDIFPRAYKLYERDGIGRLRIANTGEKPVEQVKISFITKEFMDGPTELTLRQIKPGESIDVDVKPVFFNNKILSLKENTSVKADIAVTYSMDNAVNSFSTTQSLMVILTGRSYSDTEIKRFTKAMQALDEKVAKTKAEKAVTARIRDDFETRDGAIRELRMKNLGYGEIVACLYISNSIKKSPDDIINAKINGQSWHDLMSIFDLNISDATNTLKEIADRIGVKAPKPQERKRETERYVK